VRRDAGRCNAGRRPVSKLRESRWPPADASRTGRWFYFRGSPANEVETADNNPIPSASGEPYTLALLILWKENPGTEGIFRSGSSSNGNWLWMTSSGRLWGRHANVDSPSSGSGATIPRGRAHAGARLDRP
jgi:hypothetical protein